MVIRSWERRKIRAFIHPPWACMYCDGWIYCHKVRWYPAVYRFILDQKVEAMKQLVFPDWLFTAEPQTRREWPSATTAKKPREKRPETVRETACYIASLFSGKWTGRKGWKKRKRLSARILARLLWRNARPPRREGREKRRVSGELLLLRKTTREIDNGNSVGNAENERRVCERLSTDSNSHMFSTIILWNVEMRWVWCLSIILSISPLKIACQARNCEFLHVFKPCKYTGS